MINKWILRLFWFLIQMSRAFLQLQFQCNNILFPVIKKTIKPPQKYGEANLVAYALSVANNIESIEEPSTYEEAVSCSDSGKWMIAM